MLTRVLSVRNVTLATALVAISSSAFAAVPYCPAPMPGPNVVAAVPYSPAPMPGPNVAAAVPYSPAPMPGPNVS